MLGYIWSFTIYTLGAIGILFAGYIVAKHFINNSGFNNASSPNKQYLKVEQGIFLEQKKSVYIVKAGTQRFLVASTPEGVSFLSELNKDNLPITEPPQKENVVNLSSYQQQSQVPYPQTSQTGYLDDNIQYSNFQQYYNTKETPQMHPDLEAKLKYVNFIKNALNKTTAR